MKPNLKLTIIIFLFISLLFAPLAIACTTITVSNGDTVMLGGNEDLPPNASSFLVVDNKGIYGVVYFATPWGQWPLIMMSGINEMGLSYHTNSIPIKKLNPHPERKPKVEWPITLLMKEASSVEEVLQKIFTYNWGDSIDYQIHFADKSGDAAVIHPGSDGELTYKRKSKGNGYLISANFNLAKLDNGNWLSHRYKTADKMLSKMNTRNNPTMEFMASILNATHQNSFTIYSFVYDLQNLRINLYYNRQYDTPYILEVDKELAKTKEFRKVALKELISNWNNKD